MELLQTPVFLSILYPPLVFGMPRQLFLIIAISSMAMVVSLGQFWFLAVTLLLMIGARYLSKIDIYILEIYKTLIKLPEVLD